MSLPLNPELSDAALDALITRERARVVAPLTEWHTLSSALRMEGVIRPQPSASETLYTNTAYSAPFDRLARSAAVPIDLEPPVQRNRFLRWSTRVVVGAVLLTAGVVIGRGGAFGGERAPTVKQLVADASDSVPLTSIKSPAQAQTVLARSERQALSAVSQYQRAAAYLAAHDTTARIVGGPKVYQERLAAFDQVLATTREELQATPGDPVLSQYYQSAFGAREATLQQLGQTLPASVQISHY